MWPLKSLGFYYLLISRMNGWIELIFLMLLSVRTIDFWFWTHIDGFISAFMFWIISLYYIHLYRRKYHADFILCAKSNSAAYNMIFTSLCCVITLKIILILKLNSPLLYMSDKNIGWKMSLLQREMSLLQWISSLLTCHGGKYYESK